MSSDPTASRPYMPDYGIVGPDEGAGLLPWSWTEERLTGSHDYWLATVRPDGRPHVMPVWGAWLRGALLFSTAPRSRKAKNISRRDLVVMTTDDAVHPVVIEGVAAVVADREAVVEYAEASNAKYQVDYSLDFYLENSLYEVRPTVVFGIDSDDFIGTPTRWSFVPRI